MNVWKPGRCLGTLYKKQQSTPQRHSRTSCAEGFISSSLLSILSKMSVKQFSVKSSQMSSSGYGGGTGRNMGFSSGGKGSGSGYQVFSSGGMGSGSGYQGFSSGGMGSGSGYQGFNSGGMRLGSFGIEGHEKQAMQNLNDRLARYLEKVHSLETANGQLEIQIRELLKGKTPTTSDYESYYAIIADLRAKIIAQIMSNAGISLEIDNARLAADDFKTKLDNEITLRSTVEADIDNLHGLRSEYTMVTSSIAGELELLQDELNFMKKNHAEEVTALNAQIAGSNMSIEVDSKTGPNIFEMLAELRRKYECIMDQNRAEAEQAFHLQADQVQQVVVQQNQAAMTAKNEVTEVRRSMQVLQGELGTLQGQIASLEDMLNDTRFRKQRELESYLIRLEQLEGDLASARGDINGQKCDYAKLLDEKMKLEAEIETYRRLLDGGGSGIGTSSSSMGGSSMSGGLVLLDGTSSHSSNSSLISANKTSNLNASVGNMPNYSSSTSYMSGSNTGGKSSSSYTSGGITGGNSSSSYTSGGITGGKSSSSYTSGGITGGNSSSSIISGGTTGGNSSSSYTSGGFMSEGSSSSSGAISSRNDGAIGKSYSMEPSTNK
uniref:keratin, type 1 cytoskeletal 11-like isoform X2 n=1 Tax=Myxine glutinosa TaxID=7769 RepID=UPI00358FD561